VFDFLKTWTINGPAYPWMKQYSVTRNSRASWLALLAYYEGTAARDRVKEAAYAAIVNVKYHSARKKFSFETYINIHQEAYQDLRQNDEIIPEDKCVRDLLMGIRDQSLNAAKQTIMAIQDLRGDFAATVAHLATTIQMNAAITPDNRNISGVASNKGAEGGGRGGRGRGRGGRGRGRGRGGRNIYLGTYSPDQWRALSQEDRKRVNEGRKRSAEQQQQGAVNISQVVTTQGQDQDNHSVITSGTAGASTAPSLRTADTENAGSAMTRRRLMPVNSGVRSQITPPYHGVMQVRSEDTMEHATCELDSHADTCVAGPNCVVVEYTGYTVNVSSFSSKLHGVVSDVPIVKAATAYDDPVTGDTYILIIGQAIYLGKDVENTLLCPNQLRYNGVIVDDCPMHLAPKDKPSTHSIIVPEGNFQLPLSLRGPISTFASRTPTKEELETCQWVILTGDDAWNPHSDDFNEEEEKMEYISSIVYKPDRSIMSLQRNLCDISESFDDAFFLNRFVKMTSTSAKKPGVSHEQLAQRWGIGLETAAKTIQVTTQRGIRNVSGHLEQRFKTKQAHLRYPHLSGRHGRFYTDTFFATVPTLRTCKSTQLYTNDIGFVKVYPMHSKAETFETLNTFIHEEGIPSELHSDDAKELMEGSFKRICKDFGIKTTYSEPHSPWQNRAEAGIRELKRHIHRKMKSRNVPLRLWDFCAKWACSVKACTASSNYSTEHRTPWEVVFGSTPDISSLSEYDFYQPVWYYEPGDFPEPKRHMARWLGEASHIGQLCVILYCPNLAYLLLVVGYNLCSKRIHPTKP